MKIYIPKHLRKLKVVEQLCKMIEKYQTAYYETPVNLYEYYSLQLNNDPVKKFIGICFADSFNEEDLKKSENIVNYFTKLFYSIKGCNVEVLNHLKNDLNLDIKNIEFLTGENNKTSLDIELSDFQRKRNDEVFFLNLLKEFLYNLILVDDINIKLRESELVIKEEVSYSIQADLRICKYFDISLEDEIKDSRI